MSSDSNGLKSALRPLGAALLGAGVALAVATGGNLLVGGVLAVIGLALVFAGGASAAPPPPPAPPPMPPIPQPGDNVIAATAFGAAPAAGSSAAYARADHSHGSPALPALPAPGATAPATLAFGQPASTGSSADYARADHAHGLPVPPALPDLGGDVAGRPDASRVAALQGVPLDATGAPPGAVLTFENGRWTARSLPAPPPTVTLPAPGGDLTGELAHARVSSLQGVALQAGGAAVGQVLTFDGAVWTPRHLPAPPPPPPPASDFVGRVDKPFRVVAAGEVELRINNAVAHVAAVSSYGGLRAVTATRGTTNNEFLLVVQAADGANPAQDAYSVQLTPVRATGSNTVFGASLQGGPINDSAGAVRFTAVLSSPAQLSDGQFTLRLAVLLTRFGV